MPSDFEASHDAAAAPSAQPQKIFDAPLHRAAQQLIDLGAVSDVRILQNGRVVTGIAGDRQRVYVQYQRAGRSNALTAWFHLCWRAPAEAADALDNRRQPDTGIRTLWRRFVDCEEDLWPRGIPPESALTAADFPAWLLLREPGLNLQLARDLPIGNTPAEETYRTVHRWIDARRANRSADELALRKTLQADHPVLFRYLKQNV
jgi:hypothetical protein